MEDYQKYKWFFTASGKLVMGGKSAKQNDDLLKKIKAQGKERLAMHTSQPGSPFCIIIANIEDLSQQDIKECAIFTGCFSRAWKEDKRTTEVDVFKLSQLHKSKDMNEGTWGVYGKVQKIKVNLELVMIRQHKILRAVPETAGIGAKIKLTPGSISKEDIQPKLEIELNEPLSRDEVLSALPAGKFRTLKIT
ncbi:MAG: NFACT RNA binding domain-containing protein [Nanoarchaeota archaeon]|nr:NFACT RNA binding domain-containing protein [Nanoarchaeota archaeon]